MAYDLELLTAAHDASSNHKDVVAPTPARKRAGARVECDPRSSVVHSGQRAAPSPSPGAPPSVDSECYTLPVMSDEAPKTAFELAMERLRQKDREVGTAERRLTDEQKASIAEVRRSYQAKVAEREILHRDALAKARTQEEVEKLDEALRIDLDRLAGDRDRKIDEIRKRG